MTITPFLWFDKETEEAINFYVSVFNGSPAKKVESRVVSIKRYPEGPLEEPMKGMEGRVLTAVFELEGQRFMALDGGPVFKPTEATSFLVECKDQEEIDHYWDKLTSGGDPSAQQCGWIKDKYGFSWQITPNMNQWLGDTDKERSDRTMQAMLKMKKIIIADLEKAYEGK